MFKSRNSSCSVAKAARELERQIMTMEVVSGDEPEESTSALSSSSPQEVPLPDRLCFGPYGIAPLHYDAAKDTATS